MNVSNEKPISYLSIKDNIIGSISFPSESTLEVRFVDGKKEGEGIVYSPLKVKLAFLNYCNDLLYGLCIFYNEKGEMICECVYENGIRNGWIREYNNNQTVSIGICKNGEKVSTLLPYRGNRGFNEEIQNNERIAIRNYNNDNHLEDTCYCFENNHITQVYYFQYGKKNKKMIEFEKNQMKEYDSNEAIVYVGEYEGTLLNGFNRRSEEWKYEYEEGILKRVFVCKDGKDVYK